MEVKVTIQADELIDAITKLADAITASSTASTKKTVSKKKEETKDDVNDDIKTALKSAIESAKGVDTVAEAPVENVSIEVPAPQVVEEKHYTINQIAKAGSDLCTQGKTAECMALLQKFGVSKITLLKSQEDIDAFAKELISLGAKIKV